MFIYVFSHMNLVKIMELQLLRSLVNSFPTLAGEESFK